MNNKESVILLEITVIIWEIFALLNIMPNPLKYFFGG